MYRRILPLLTIVLVLGLALSACAVQPAAPAAEEAAPAEEAAAEGGAAYVLVPKNLGNPYFDTANKGAQEAAAELGVDVTYQGSATADATEQIQLLNSLISQQVDGLAISANDADALVPTGQAAMDAGHSGRDLGLGHRTGRAHNSYQSGCGRGNRPFAGPDHRRPHRRRGADRHP